MSERKPPKAPASRPSKVQTDGSGRSVWVDTIETVNLKLVSTQELKVVLESDDDDSRESMQEAIDAAGDGVLARDPKTGRFEVIDENDLREMLEDDADIPAVGIPSDFTLEPAGNDAAAAPDELSLVSTQALRKVLGSPDPEEPETPPSKEETGFDPYDNS